MKLREIVEDSPKKKEVMDWLSHYMDTSNSQEATEYYGTHINNQGECTLKLINFGLSAKNHAQVYDPPISANWYGHDTLDQFHLTGGTDGSNVIDSFDKIPNCGFLWLETTTINSLKGIEHLTRLKTIHLDTGNSVIKCGLLRLLKMPNAISLAVGSDWKNKFPELTKAFDIVKAHMMNGKNIPECQQELIEEGLQEYAKL